MLIYGLSDAVLTVGFIAVFVALVCIVALEAFYAWEQDR